MGRKTAIGWLAALVAAGVGCGVEDPDAGSRSPGGQAPAASYGSSASSSSGGGEGQGEACSACMDTLDEECAAAYEACFERSGCVMWLSCVEDCMHGDDDDACYVECDERFLSSNSANQNLKSCVCGACAAECSSFCTCGLEPLGK